MWGYRGQGTVLNRFGDTTLTECPLLSISRAHRLRVVVTPLTWGSHASVISEIRMEITSILPDNDVALT
jgi:hypothetical protein